MSKARSRRRPITLADILERSGLHHKILEFAMFNGYRIASSDQTFDERVAVLRARHPEMDHNDALTAIGREFTEDVTEFFRQKFPVVGRNR